MTSRRHPRRACAGYSRRPRSSAASGVILPPGNLNDEVIVVNGDSADNLFIYPQVGGKINRATANAALELPPNTSAHFRGENSLNWAAFF
mgnify:CR=1 FL=1